jgi:CRP/FNR family cyclic AMP-dependent transcriptional regulator
MDKYVKLLNTVPHFKSFKPSDLLRIINSGHIKQYRKDRQIYREGDSSAGMFVLFTGKVHLCNYSCEGQIQIFSMIKPVIMFNEITAIDGGPNPATAVAVKDCLTWNIEYEAFENLVKQYPDPAIGLALLRVMAGRTRELIELCSDLSFRPVLSRCAKLLFDLSDKGTKPIVRKEYPLVDLSARVATAPESISRSLSMLDKKGIISTDRSRITVIKVDDLMEIAFQENS